ncbi:MAG: ATPase domain-containing protein [Desulfurococcaceae archaeon]
MTQKKVFFTGIEGLDKLVGEMRAPYTMLIAGHPGSGKTTLASTICYHNTLKGKKCLYITFYEDKDKFFSYMERLGIQLRDVELKGELKFIKLPLSLPVDGILDSINRILSEGFDIVVIDSVTALLDGIIEDFAKRAWLLNYFYNLSSTINGLLILISELASGEEKLSVGFAEFVVDAIFLLKHRVEDRRLIRLLEMRKIRGAPLDVAEVPFSIVEKRGIVIYNLPKLEDLPRESPRIDHVCRVFKEKIGHLHKEFLVNVLYPPETIFGREVLVYLLALAVKYNYKILTISYITPPYLLKDILVDLFKAGGISQEASIELLDKRVVFKAINPFAYSIHELAMRELELIQAVKPDIVIFHGTHIINSQDKVSHLKELYKEVMFLKSIGVGVVRIGNCVDQSTCDAESSIADLTLKTVRIYNDNATDYRVLIARRFEEPSIIRKEEIMECIAESIDLIKESVHLEKEGNLNK